MYCTYHTRRKRSEEVVDEEKTNVIPNRKKHSPKRWVVYRKDKLMAQQVQETVHTI